MLLAIAIAMCGNAIGVTHEAMAAAQPTSMHDPHEATSDHSGTKKTLSPADQIAQTTLNDALARLQLVQPTELCTHAMNLLNGAGGHSKQPKAAAPLLQIIADAANISSVPRSNSSAAARELGHLYLRGESVDSDIDMALSLYERAARHGDSEAQHALGILHSSGFGAGHDPALAATYLHFAAEGGAIGAQLSLGYRHLLGVSAPRACKKSLMYYTPVAAAVVANTRDQRTGRTIEKVRLTIDHPQGNSRHGADDDIMHYYEHSALKGSVDAQLTLGHLHFHGARGMNADAGKALAYYRKAAAAGDPTAFSQLGTMYAQGIVVEQDNSTALEYFRKGAAKEHPASQNGLGYMYMHGHGVRRDYKKASEYFRLAAERGNAEAQFNLGAMHIAGLHLKRAYDKALHYFTLSAHQGHTLALYNLAQMHLNGFGTPRSCPIAAQFLKAVAERGPWSAGLEEANLALQAGSPSIASHLYASLAEAGFELAQSNAAFLLDQHYMQSQDTSIAGVQGEKVAARAISMYQLAAQQGSVEAELKLGDYFYYGYGTDVDLEAAVGHYRTATDHRSAQAMFNLAYMYAHGLGLNLDYHLAKRHYDMALDTASDVWAPVRIALLELTMLQTWDAQMGGHHGTPYEYLSSWTLLQIPIAAASRALPQLSSLLTVMTSHADVETIALIALCMALAFVLLLRRRAQNAQP